jgi:hypothetical protein
VPSLDLDDDHFAPVATHEIEFAYRCSLIPRHHVIASLRQKGRGGLLAVTAAGNPVQMFFSAQTTLLSVT